MVITPDSYVKLIRIDLTPSHQLTFNSIEEQTSFFENFNGFQLSDFSYQRKDKMIRYPRCL